MGNKNRGDLNAIINLVFINSVKMTHLYLFIFMVSKYINCAKYQSRFVHRSYDNSHKQCKYKFDVQV